MLPTSAAPAKHSTHGDYPTLEIKEMERFERESRTKAWISSFDPWLQWRWKEVEDEKGAGVRIVPLGHENQSKDRARMGAPLLLDDLASFGIFYKNRLKIQR